MRKELHVYYIIVVRVPDHPCQTSRDFKKKIKQYKIRCSMAWKSLVLYKVVRSFNSSYSRIPSGVMLNLVNLPAETTNNSKQCCYKYASSRRLLIYY